jgi:hypothetical protein
VLVPVLASEEKTKCWCLRDALWVCGELLELLRALDALRVVIGSEQRRARPGDVGGLLLRSGGLLLRHLLRAMMSVGVGVEAFLLAFCFCRAPRAVGTFCISRPHPPPSLHSSPPHSTYTTHIPDTHTSLPLHLNPKPHSSSSSSAMGKDGHDDDEGTPYDQPLEEVEFLRSACSAAQRGELDKLTKMLAKKPHLVVRGGGGRQLCCIRLTRSLCKAPGLVALNP